MSAFEENMKYILMQYKKCIDPYIFTADDKNILLTF